MRAALLAILVAVSATAGCVVPPPAGTPIPPKVAVLTADARALQYGSSAGEIFGHQTLGPAIRALFGSDWQPGTGARPTLGAPEFFSKSGPIRMLRVGEADYIALTGCRAQSCATHQGLLLIRQGGEELLARLEEGGFVHYYGHGAGLQMTPERRALLEAAWRASRA
jgi:hypothetical protein